MATLKKLIQDAPRMRGSLPIKAKKGATIKKAQSGEYLTQEGNNYTSTKKVSTTNGPRYYEGKSMDMNTARRMSALKGRANSADSIPKAKVPMKALEALSKAKDGKWIQKAVNPKHKGYCTPMTKATCTPKRKALAKTFKKMGAERKAKNKK